MPRKIVVIGGVAGGMSAAARARRLDEHAEITVYERGPYVSFANCGLPYYIGSVIRDRQNLVLLTPEELKAKMNINVRVRHEVVRIMPQEKKVLVKDLETGETFEDEYEKLVLSPGAAPIRPPFPGVNADNVFTLRTIPDTDRIVKFIREKRPKRAIVVGAGFIGLEMVENLHHLGIRTTIIEMLNQVLPPIDFELAIMLNGILRQKNIGLELGTKVTAIEHEDSRSFVNTEDGRKFECDFVVISIGVRPEVQLAKDAGLELGQRGIKVDTHMQTSDPDIYAVGDAVECEHFVTREPSLIPLAGPANRQGRIAADNVCGRQSEYRGTLGTAIVKLFDITVACTGVNERELKRVRRDYERAYLHPYSHASYYPGAQQMTMKLLFSKPEGKLLGAQIVGGEGTDKRIDVLATAINAGLTVFDLEHLELAYAPPFGSAKDPVNLAGNVASNILRGDVRVVHWDQVDDLLKQGGVILDVRTRDEYDLGHILDSLNIPLREMRNRLDQIPKDKPVIVTCGVGQRAYFAARLLMQHGFENVYNLCGGQRLYSSVFCPPEGQIPGTQLPGAPAPSAPGAPCVRTSESAPDIELDLTGLQCPGPLLRIKATMEEMMEGQILRATISDRGFLHDAGAWCSHTGNTLLSVDQQNGIFVVTIQKGQGQPAPSLAPVERQTGKTIVVFSGDLDRVMAAFIIANGAAAMGDKVTMFFTFWGLNVLRREEHVPVEKGFLDKMFGAMMPRGANKLKLSKMNMGGMGTAMMRYVMKTKNVPSLPELIETARKNGVRLTVCNMSMEVMGIKPEELIDGVEFGGVASFLSTADESNVTLFV